MNYTNLLLRLNNYPLNKAQSFLKNIKSLDEKKFRIFVENQKKEIVTYHIENTSFYRSLVLKKDLKWDDLPVLEKKDFQKPLKKRLSRNYTLKNIFKNKTSGSTGNPFYFAKDKFCHALTWSYIQTRFEEHNLFNKKQARFYGIPKSIIPYYKERFKDLFLNRYRFDVFNLTDNDFKVWLKIFKRKKFVYLNGYTTVIVLFARFLVNNKIVLKDFCKTLQACVVTSEMLFKTDRELLKKAFGVKIINEYGASELDLIAFEDQQNQWILNNETLFVEILDNENNPVKDGVVGNIVITSLFNKAHPFIRYKIGDRGAIRSLGNKRIVLEKLEGRKEDVILLPSGKVSPGLTFYYITKSVMEDASMISEIKVIQKKINEFVIEYVSNEGLNTQQKEIIKKALLVYLEPNLMITFKKTTSLKRTNSGKLKQFTSLIN